MMTFAKAVRGISTSALVLTALLSPAVNAKTNTATTASQAPTSTSTESSRSSKFGGLADYYAEKFHGRKTASGQLHDKTKFTCAHRTLPFGTRLKVVNRRNGKTCIVTVNDRGPYTRSKVIDLSHAAASQIGLVSMGTASVDCMVLKDDEVTTITRTIAQKPGSPKSQVAQKQTKDRVQLASKPVKHNLDAMSTELSEVTPQQEENASPEAAEMIRTED